MRVVTAEEMGEVDRRTAEEFGVPRRELMEAAGEAVAAFILRQYPNAERVIVLCGRGNNGGDGFVAARVLAGAGVELRVLLVGEEGGVKGDAAEALAALKAATSDEIVESVVDEVGLEGFAEALGEADLLVDAVVGTGFKPPLRGVAARLRDVLAGLSVPVVAVDLPSGWDADSMEQGGVAGGEPQAPRLRDSQRDASSSVQDDTSFRGQAGVAPDATSPAGGRFKREAFRADAVVTFTAPKLAHVFGHLTDRTFGPVVVAEIGSPAEAIVSGTGLHWIGVSKAITEPARDVNSNKGKFGHVLVVGGSYGKSGAPRMASLACLRAGAGLVTAAVPVSIVDTVAQVASELMVVALLECGGLEGAGRVSRDTPPLAKNVKDGAPGVLPSQVSAPLPHPSSVALPGVATCLTAGDVGFGTASVANLQAGRLDRLLKGIKVVAVGPGLSTDGEAPEFVRGLVAYSRLPMVLDADALNAFESQASLLDGRGRTLVLTPHPGEMARLAGMTVKEVEADRVGLARRFAVEHQVTLVLKGWRTLVAHPDGRVGVNTTGNPSMAKGGSGDILTGIVAGMLAQFPGQVEAAVEAAVFLHGLAADFAATQQDEHTVLATDTVAHLSDAFRYRVRDEDGLTWLVGARKVRG